MARVACTSRALLALACGLAACALAAPSAGLDDGIERWIEPIAWHPRAFLYHGFLSQAECEHIKDTARPRLERSEVVDPDTGGSKLDDIRTSWGTFLQTAETPTIQAIEQRIAEWAQVPVENHEQLQILRYGVGQKYSDHWDWFDKKTIDVDPAHNTQRVATEVEEGGETVFPLKSEWADETAAAAAGGFSECAQRGPGDAILFWSLTLTGEEDEASMHASCPVIRGEKWTATKWMHTSEFKLLNQPQRNTCEDLKDECRGWAEHEECVNNAAFMVGYKGMGGTCVKSCCSPQRREGVPAADCAACDGS